MKKDANKSSNAAKLRRQAKARLGPAPRRGSDKQYRILFDSADDAIFIHDKEGRILAANMTACEQYGYTRSELMSMTAGLMVIPEKRIHVKKRLAQMMKQGSLRFETVHQRKDGTSLQVDVNSRRITWNGQAAIMSICRDITALKRAEQKLAEAAEDKFKTIFNHASDGILLVDPENRKFFMGNNTICRMLGYSLEEIIKLRVKDIHPEKDIPYVMEQFQKQARGDFTLAKDMPVKRKDGSVFYADINAAVMTIDGNKYMAGFFHDITERK
ncbi:MAG: PAS domain S-box protein, partial [Kiritimatiellota bacterium]|nr:PAS domain S-box protein [Kiritimatiellota bacterium]